MNTTSEQNIRIIFGLKVKQQRQKQGLSFADLAHASGLSVSYLNEIEKGKKYPKTEKIIALANALNTNYDYLVSLKLDNELAPMSWILNSNILDNLPLDIFGLEVDTILEMIANAPAKVNAFINTVIKIARNYELSREHFHFAALRSFQEMHDNYFDELEVAAENFIREHDLDVTPPVSRRPLYDILQQEYGYTIDRDTLREYPDLVRFRSIFVPAEKRLIINDALSNTQKSFLLGKEIAYNYLKLKERPYTSNVLSVNSFEEALNNFKASYFSVALLLNRKSVHEDLKTLFEQKTWQPEMLLNMLEKYAASPEMFLHRISSLLKQFGINDFFFLRLTHSLDSDKFDVTKELHFARPHNPHRNDLDEHYCRRWVSVRLLQDLRRIRESGETTRLLVDAQRSHYIDSNQEYLCITIASPNAPTPDSDVSVTLGFYMDEHLKRRIHFWKDPAIPIRMVNETCERCSLADCAERAGLPTVATRQKRIADMQAQLRTLIGDV